MMSEPSTTSPKSMAPRLIRLPVCPVSTMQMMAKSIASGIVRREDQPGAQVREQQQQHDDHEDGALAEVPGDRPDGPPDELGAVVVRLDDDALGERRLDLRRSGP